MQARAIRHTDRVESPSLQYATTSDDHDIAFAVSGSGPVLISVPSPPDNHLQLEWDDPARRRSLELISGHRTLVRFDGRGTGLSDREATDFSIEGRTRDLEAVVRKVGAERFALMSGGFGNQVSLAYAAQNPDRVTGLVLVNPTIIGADFMPAEQLGMWRHMLQSDFRFFTEAVGAKTFGWGSEDGPRYGAYFRECVTAKTAGALYEAMFHVDSGPLLPQIACPVLVMRTPGSEVSPERDARRIVAAIPNARLVVVPGQAVEGATPGMLQAMGEFFGEDWGIGSDHPAHGPVRAASGIQTVLFTDVEGHTAIIQRLGDAGGRDVLREHEAATRRALREFGGTEVKSMGDGFMASFHSVLGALDCAIALQRAIHQLSDRLPVELRIRVGINTGEPIAEDGDLFGTSVIVAARLAALAAGGEILVANVVRELSTGKGYLFSDRGMQELKGMEDPVHTWQLRWSE